MRLGRQTSSRHFANYTFSSTLCMSRVSISVTNSLVAPSIIKSKKLWKKTISSKDHVIWLMNNILSLVRDVLLV